LKSSIKYSILVTVDGEKSPKYSVLPEPNPSCVQVETFFLPFELACQSKTPKIVCSALDSIEKLVAYGHISYQHFGDDSDYAIYDTGFSFLRTIHLQGQCFICPYFSL
jgi:hypothetical protein